MTVIDQYQHKVSYVLSKLSNVMLPHLKEICNKVIKSKKDNELFWSSVEIDSPVKVKLLLMLMVMCYSHFT